MKSWQTPPKIIPSLFFSAITFVLGYPALVNAAAPPLEFSGEIPIEHVPHLTDIERMLIQQQVSNSIQSLTQGGVVLPQGNGGMAQPSFIWPVRKAIGVEDFDVDAISNYVDQDPSNPGSILDYNCGARTYDLQGYDHAGIDIFSWPFSWIKKNNDEVEIIAAAPGTIVYKSDGNNDNNCGFGGGNWNAVYVMQADGSVTWYGHMKKSSLTSKAVGDSVAAGEYLGVMGSSGNSTGPHLHMEVYDSQGNLIDPFAGSCNALNNDSWWQNQENYYVSRINALGVGTAPASFNPCPQEAVTNFENTYLSGDSLYFSAFYRDQLSSTASDYFIERPDGSTFTTWNHSPGQAHYAASWFAWGYSSFVNSDTGIWKFKVDYESKNYEKEFYLVNNCAVNYTVPTQTLNSTISYGASNNITTATNTVNVAANSRMTLLAGNKVTLGNGLSVAGSGELVVKNVLVCD